MQACKGHTQALFDAVRSADKTFPVFSAEGGARHCQRGPGVIFYWLAEKL